MKPKFFILNLTKNTKQDHNGDKWPAPILLEGFAGPGDTLELVRVETSPYTYRSGLVNYYRQTVYIIGTERINANGLGYVGARQRAADWLAEIINPTGTIMPLPRCEECHETRERISDVQVIRDCGFCPACRVPKKILVQPKRKK